MTTATGSVQFLPYGRQHLAEEDIQAVVKVLRSEWWTQGPAVNEFEQKLAVRVGTVEAVACANGTAALHLTMLSLGVGPGDIVVTSANSFLASANCARYVGADVRFVDINASTGLMDVDQLESVLAADADHRIKAVVPVHFAGQPLDIPRLYRIVHAHGAFVVSDSCHALGATYKVNGSTYSLGSGAHNDASVFSFHPVKHVATGEGGAITTDNHELAERLRSFRNHGMQKEDFTNDQMATSATGELNPWYYEMQEMGYNYRLTDLQATLGVSQLGRLDRSVKRRNELAHVYHRLIAERFDRTLVCPLEQRPHVTNAYHLFVVRIDFERYQIERASVMMQLRRHGIGTQVHYIPIYLQPYYRRLYDGHPGDLPQTDRYYTQALSLPMYPNLNESDCERVVDQLDRILKRETDGHEL
ncbi:MAG: UDP-4-amino-4,6-dideoxy-N-acetyl-beta-L-altrosamine transaminase [candidate division Zixibacteria bacterium]|nr:UDP-4-amino-4,6-dideoxy-N-acetyl-beta-L-altrosamine transaminase [candidate division Zixibacteria bacterium]MDH3938052.1 UDP-4-amino-4,6-dideoxy-N-acetyl-beta-L-altrosamine transaminase [candidate division Zixibacteria bacterium]MDH4033941.1 UDP-4-amino-4,6-dideoxy-N-acetyl-beta-L-altrosamine transaminase [candidate division Zixibacteria bacterium]